MRLRAEIPLSARVVLAFAGVAGLFGLWWFAATFWSTNTVLVPSPSAAWNAGVDYWNSGELGTDFAASATRVLKAYSISMGIGIVLGLAIGSFRSVESFWESPIGFLRYIPATALTPLFLLWLGIDEPPKVALIIAGTVFYNILMIADVARSVPRELIATSYTLGAGRTRVLRRVVLPHAWPGIIDVARINLAAAWLMLVVAELLAAQDGLAYRLVQSQRLPPGRPDVRDPHHLRADRRRERPRAARSAEPHGTLGAAMTHRHAPCEPRSSSWRTSSRTSRRAGASPSAPSTGSTSRSPTARSSASWVHRAVGSRRC